MIIGNTITFTSTVTDTSGSSAPTTTVSWSAGGSFSSSTCTLTTFSSSSSTCVITYTPSSTGTGTITASYAGDGSHSPSFGTSTLTVETPTQALQSLIVQVQGLGQSGSLNGGQVNSLVVKLNHVIDKIGSTNACNGLNAFASEVQSLVSDGILTSAQGGSLISQAQSVESALAC